ncbi:hypothetical protein HPP92_022333 [Vanilla planifolia]|uniref:Pentatricopeptide repeat-containing protein n=1 Tax=Vanilla planifolia TaxID=51239 RepID=A0A835UFJ6_VANPL|nr:hypothetical protein HPP92_022333 [Vanilla planifolia]
MPDRNPVSWTVLIGSYTRHGFAIEALELFRTMVSNGMQPDQFTFSSCLCASSAIASLKHGKQIHARLLRTRFNPNAIVLSSLIDMYSKCGDFEGCRRVFHNTSIRRRDVVIWNTVMSALGHHGHGREVIRLFEEMIRTGTRPDANTFVVLLTSCSHSGLVSEGLHFFESMHQQHGIVPEENHLVCLVDLLGRAGCFKEAMDWLCQKNIISLVQELGRHCLELVEYTGTHSLERKLPCYLVSWSLGHPMLPCHSLIYMQRMGIGSL